MRNNNTEKLIIVQNPTSTRAALIEEKVFAPLHEHDIAYEVYHTQFKDTEDNIAAMREAIPDNSTVINAAGDGTAMQLVNAALRDRKDITFGFVPLGNFNDIARTHVDRNQTIIDIIDAPTTPLRPLTIERDGEYWRHAPAYMTMGWTALAASEFGGAESREAMQDTPRSLKLAKSLAQLAGNYFTYRDTKLPAFQINNGYRYEDSTDILAVNNPRVGSIVRSNDFYPSQNYFGMRADIDVSKIMPNIPFGLKAISGYTPLERAEQMSINFLDRAAHVPVQTEGEFEWITAQEIFVYKNPNDVLQVLHPKRTSRV